MRNIKKWNEIRSILQNNYDKTRFDTWIKDLSFVEYEDESNLVLMAENTFKKNFIKDQHSKTILKYAKKVYENIDFVTIITENEQFKISTSHTKINKDTNISNTKHNLNEKFTFEEFVLGPNNEFAKNVSMAVADNPGNTKFNPLLIYGGVGLGKTHLLQAIGNYVIQTNEKFNVNFVTSEEFYNDFVDSIKNNNRNEFTEKYKKSNILLIDDIQFIAGKESTQEEFFHIFNALHMESKQIVLTSDLPPASIQGLHERLVSRFQWGLCVDVQPPDLETRLAILKKKAEKDHLNIEDDIIHYIAENVPSNVRNLEGIIIQLLAFSSITNTDITIDLVKTILKDKIQKNSKKRISVELIIDVVANYYAIPENSLREKNRSKEIALYRQIAMYISKKYTNHSLKTIGLNFGGRDHSTVIHAVNNIKKLKEKDKTIKEDINNIVFKLDL